MSGTRDELVKRLNEALTLPKPFDAETLLAVVDFVATRLEVAAAKRSRSTAATRCSANFYTTSSTRFISAKRRDHPRACACWDFCNGKGSLCGAA